MTKVDCQIKILMTFNFQHPQGDLNLSAFQEDDPSHFYLTHTLIAVSRRAHYWIPS